MSRIAAAVLLAASTALAADPPAPPATPPPAAASSETSTCRGTLHGAVEATFTCAVSAFPEGTGVRFKITPSGPIAGLRGAVLGDYLVAGPIQTGRYDDATRPAGTSRVETKAGRRFEASSQVDAVILQVDSVERHPRSAAYVVSGSFEARLVAKDGRGGEIELKATF